MQDLQKAVRGYAPLAVVMVAVAVAGRSPVFAPFGWLPPPLELLGWLSIGALAAFHQPLGAGTLGLGTLVLMPAALRLGAVPATVLAGLVLAATAAVRALVARRTTVRPALQPLATRLGASAAVRREEPQPAAGRVWPDLVWTRLAPVLGATLAATTFAVSRLAAGAQGQGASYLGDWPAAGRILLPALVYAATFAVLVQAARFLSGDAPAGGLRPLGLDAAGWMLGALLAEAAPALGWPRVVLLLAALAALAAEAARNAVLRHVSDHRVGDLERVHRANVRILGETSGMGEIARQVLIECRNVLPVEWFQFELADDVADGDERSWFAGPPAEAEDVVLYAGRPQPPERPPMLPGVHRRAAWRVIEETLAVEGETLALVRLWCDPRRLKEEAEELFATLLPHMASSVHRARLDREARLDALTGIPVRRLLESGMQRAYRRSCEEGRSMAIIMCDVDFFKRVNDTYGHSAGDEALILVARTLDATRREGDLCCRYGGEEFALLLEDAGGEAALQLAERLRSAVGSLQLVFEGKAIPLTLSAGIAAFPELHVKTASELLLLADEALYRAKETGRNRCLLNLGGGSYRSPAGPAIRAQPPAESNVPRFF